MSELHRAVTSSGDNGGEENAMSTTVDDPSFAWANARDLSVTDTEAAACAVEMRIR